MGKSSKAAKADRQKVIDDIRRQQKRADSRQGMWIILVCGGIAAAIIVAAAWQPVSGWLRTETISADTLAEIGAAPDVCNEVTTSPSVSAGHVEPNQVQYTVAPPATGDHWNIRNEAPVPVTQRFYSRGSRPDLELEQLIHNSEHGYTILWYDDTVNDGEIAEIRKMSQFLDDNDTNGRFKFKAVPWTQADVDEVEEQQEIALTAAQDAVSAAEDAVEAAGDDEEAKATAEQQLTAAEEQLTTAEENAGAGGNFPEDTHIAFTHWTADSQAVHQYCSGPSGEALDEFMKDYPYSDSPEPNAM